MGQAKQKAALQSNNGNVLMAPSLDEVKRVSAAVRKLMSSASVSLGLDCYTHAAFAHHLFNKSGFNTKIVVGNAMWRVGDGHGDVITHDVNAENSYSPDNLNAIPYHAWLEIGYYIIDVTTYQLGIKAKLLDEADGGSTSVEWCPDFIFANKKSVSPRESVANLHPGLFYYERVPEIESMILAAAKPIEAEDLDLIDVIYASGDIIVVGPNDIGDLS